MVLTSFCGSSSRVPLIESRMPSEGMRRAGPSLLDGGPVRGRLRLFRAGRRCRHSTCRRSVTTLTLVTFFVGSLCFTAAGFLQYREAGDSACWPRWERTSGWFLVASARCRLAGRRYPSPSARCLFNVEHVSRVMDGGYSVHVRYGSRRGSPGRGTDFGGPFWSRAGSRSPTPGPARPAGCAIRVGWIAALNLLGFGFLRPVRDRRSTPSRPPGQLDQSRVGQRLVRSSAGLCFLAGALLLPAGRAAQRRARRGPGKISSPRLKRLPR